MILKLVDQSCDESSDMYANESAQVVDSCLQLMTCQRHGTL